MGGGGAGYIEGEALHVASKKTIVFTDCLIRKRIVQGEQ